MGKKFRIGIALGSGGAKGFAHIGVLDILEKNGIEIDCVSGSSMGAVVGGLYASGLTPEELESKVLSLDKKTKKGFFKKSLSLESIYDIKEVHKRLYGMFKDKTFKDLRIPFFAVATDLISGQKVTFTSGKLIDAVEASSRIPLYYPPKKAGDKVLVDGAVLCPVPTGLLKKECDFVISVPIPNYDKTKHPRHYVKALNIMDRSLALLIEKLMKLELKSENPDFVISLEETAKYSAFEFDKAEEIIVLGRSIALSNINSLIKKINEKKKKFVETV